MPTAAREPPRRLAVLLNAGAGSLSGRDPESLGLRLASLFAERGVAASVEHVPSAELRAAAEGALTRFRAGEIGGLAVGGGDGSIGTVAAVLAGTGLPLGILPLGTLNHFAKDLRLPMALEAAVDVICAGATRSVDVGEVNGRVFVNNSSIGIYPFMVADRDRRRSSFGLAKWTAMVLAALRMWRQFPVRRLTICVEGRSAPFRTPCLFVGNNEYGLSLGALGRRDRLDDGELWLCVSRARSRLALLWLGLRSILGLLDGERDLQALRAHSAEIRSRTSRLLVAIDGEVETMRPPLSYRVRPRDLTVFAPPSD